MNNNMPTTIKQKLMNVQKAFKTFAVEEESAKKKENGASSYKYTPGWKIVEAIREKLDGMNIMLTLNNVKITNAPETYAVYKDFNGKLVKLDKTEILTTIEGDYTFEDVDTGETAGPYHYAATGANGMDKSCASAYSLLERYFLLKHFHITTREKDDEPDAHDTDTVPGMEAYGAPTGRTTFDGNLQPYGQAQQNPYPAQYPYGGPLFQPQPQQPLYPPQQPPQTAYPGAQQQGAQRGRHNQQAMPGTAPMNSGTALMATKYANHPDVNALIDALSHFDKGTTSAMQVLNDGITRLGQNGYTCTSSPDFLSYITETAQAKREGRMPNYT